MFFGKKKPTTVAAAIAGLVEAVNDLDAVRDAQAQLANDKRVEANQMVMVAEAAESEAEHAASVAAKLREITEA